MPRIKANSVAEHVAQQEAVVFRAAIELFTDRGYDAVSLADIASAVGLARNSLYRYFPSKADILLRWCTQELAAEIERSERLLGGSLPPGERIRTWALAQLDYASTPGHELIAALADRVSELDATGRASLADSHRLLYEPLDQALLELGRVDPDERGAVAALVVGLITAAARHEATGAPPAVVRRQVVAAIDALITR